MATGWSDCISRARIPPMNIEVSRCTRQIASAGLNQRSPSTCQTGVELAKSGPFTLERTAVVILVRARESSLLATIPSYLQLRRLGRRPARTGTRLNGGNR